MDGKRHSSNSNLTAALRICSLCWVMGGFGSALVWGQIPAPITGGPNGTMPAPVYYEPETNSVYDPSAPAQRFGVVNPGYGPGGFDTGLPNSNGMQQPGEMQNVQFSQNLGDFGNVQLYGDPTGQGGFGGNYRARPATFAHVRDLQMGVYTNETQTVINGGSTFEFYVNDRFGVAGRVLLGGANNQLLADEFHFSGDLWGGMTFSELWFKGGVLYDTQDNFHKVGPAFGALVFPDHKHPISIDIAYGIGYGDDVIDRAAQTILAVADDDTQVRIGTYLFPNAQVGFSGNWVNFADGQFEDYNGYGGFVSLNLGEISVNVDVTHGDDRTRGFVNVAYQFGGRRARPQNNLGQPVVVEHPRDWITRHIMRDTALQLQLVRNANIPPIPGQPPVVVTPPVVTPPPVVGNVSNVNCIVAAPRLANQIDTNNNGIVDPGDLFELDFQFVNNTNTTATNVSFGQNATVIGNGSQAGFVGATVGDVLPGTTLTTDDLDDACIAVDATAQPGDQIFVEFDVSADGATRRFRCGPFIVGQTAFNGQVDAAQPL